MQAFGSREEDEPSTITVLGQEVAVDEEFVHLGSLVHSTTESSADNDNEVYFTLAASNSQIDRYRTVVE